MIKVTLIITMLFVGAAFLVGLARLIKGPDIIDRVFAVDTLYINALAVLTLYGIWLQSRLFFEVSLLIALFGFVSTVVISKYILRGGVIES